MPEKYIPIQYIFRAIEAKKILSITDQSTNEIASRIAIAELCQVICFAIQAITYSLAYSHVITPLAAGIAAFVVIPFETLSAYHTFVHFKPFSRMILTAAAVFTLTACAFFAVFGIVKDSAITLCAGGVALHVFRNISEFIDAKNAKKNAHYRAQVLNITSSSAYT